MFVAGSTTGSASRCSWAPCASSAPSWLTPTDVPELVVVHVAAQLGIADPGVFKGYAQRRSSQWEHAEQIRTAYGGFLRSAQQEVADEFDRLFER